MQKLNNFLMQKLNYFNYINNFNYLIFNYLIFNAKINSN